ncbi:porimin [Cynocephalus volans]|uniref:porimin n=1 Tax=Cynocephalus volans TaxID=110931 RepID=UPI002FCC78F9
MVPTSDPLSGDPKSKTQTYRKYRVDEKRISSRTEGSHPNQDSIFIILLHQPQGRYVSLQSSKGNQNADFSSQHCKSRQLPTPPAPPPSHSTNLFRQGMCIQRYSEPVEQIRHNGGMEITSFRAQRSPARSVFGEAAALAFISDNKTAISEKKRNSSRVFGFPGGWAGRRVTTPTTASPAPSPPPPRPPPLLGSLRPLQARLPRPIWSFGGRRQEGRRTRRKGTRTRKRGRSRRRRRHLAWGPTRPLRPARGTMGLGARGAWAALLLGVLQVLAQLGAAENGTAPAGSSNPDNSVPPPNSSVNSTENMQHVPFNLTSESLNSTVKPSTTSVSSVSTNTTVTASKTIPTSKMATPGVSTNTTSTTLTSVSKTSVSQNTTQMSTSRTTISHNSSVTSVSSSVTITATIHSKENKGSKFDIGSFVGGIVLTLGVLSILYIGCKMYYSRRGIQYRTIDEHDAII